jgi:hypothetical protein
VVAGPAVAKTAVKHKMSAKQKAHVRAQLRKQIRKNPAAIKRKSFLKKAALVNFKLPVTLRLRGGNTGSTPCNGLTGLGSCQPTPGVVGGSTNPNKAMLDLGASLGQREVDLGGTLAAEITFHDSFDGGALGNVDLSILPSQKALKSTSIPLLWNSQVTQAGSRFDANDLYLDQYSQVIPGTASGCGNFTGSTIPFGANIPAPLVSGGFYGSVPQPGGLPGYPVSDIVGGGGSTGFLPINTGINDVVGGPLSAGTMPGNNDIVGGNPAPFPGGGIETPSGFYGGSAGVPTVKDTVLRTNALDLTVATGGTVVNNSNTSPTDGGAEGSENQVIGKSGGQANLFGNIPGKSYGIDVTVNLATKINSIIRAVDQDSFHTGLYGAPTQYWPAGVFNCQQIWTGYVQNYIPDVRLTGNLKIAPGLTSDGHLRIAKATVASQAGFPAHFAVAACLFPHTTYAKRQNNPTVPGPTANSFANGLAPVSLLPVDSAAYEPKPSAACNSTPDSLVANSGLAGVSSVGPLTPATSGNGYSVANDGSRVSVGADLNVTNVSIDVLIGDV